MGCYTEATSGRALIQEYDTAEQTVKECVDACSANNYIYAGLEYGGEVSKPLLRVDLMLSFA